MVFLPFVRVVHRRKLVDLTEERRLQWMAEVRLKEEKQEEEERQERIALEQRRRSQEDGYHRNGGENARRQDRPVEQMHSPLLPPADSQSPSTRQPQPPRQKREIMSSSGAQTARLERGGGGGEGEKERGGGRGGKERGGEGGGCGGARAGEVGGRETIGTTGIEKQQAERPAASSPSPAGAADVAKTTRKHRATGDDGSLGAVSNEAQASKEAHYMAKEANSFRQRSMVSGDASRSRRAEGSKSAGGGVVGGGTSEEVLNTASPEMSSPQRALLSAKAALNSALLLPSSPRGASLASPRATASSPSGATNASQLRPHPMTACTSSGSSPLLSPRANGVVGGVPGGANSTLRSSLRTSVDSALRSASDLFDMKVLQVLQPASPRLACTLPKTPRGDQDEEEEEPPPTPPEEEEEEEEEEDDDDDEEKQELEEEVRSPGSQGSQGGWI